jgi:class 3 adenylate cyclase
MTHTLPPVGLEELVFAVTSVSGATAAGRDRGDLETATILAEYYGLVAATLGSCEGRVVKVLGDGVLVVFPIHRAEHAVGALRDLQASANALWSSFDARCRVQIKVGAGRLATGRMGPPGAERFDVYGTALNDLFRIAAGDFVIMPGLVLLLG